MRATARRIELLDPGGKVTTSLDRLLRRLERWLPTEAERLTRLRDAGVPDAVAEAEWSACLRAYERISLAQHASRVAA